MSASLRMLMLGDGQSFHVERMLAELRRQGIDVRLASLEHSSIVDYPLKRRGPVKSLHYLLSVAEIEALVDKLKPNILYAHYATGYGHVAALANKGRKLPFFLNLWGSDILIVPEKSPLHRSKAVKALKAATHLFADSQYLFDAAALLCGHKLEGTVIPWGVEADYLHMFEAQRPIGKPVKVIVPRAHEIVYENLFVVEALQSEIRSGEIELTFPSFGSQAGSFRAAADRLADGRVKYYDKLMRSEFMRFYSSFDVALSNSRSDSSPVSLIEAMALGLIVVARDIPGVREWIDDQSGFLYPSQDKEAIRKVIRSLSADAGRLVQMRQRNRNRVEIEAVFEENIAAQIEIMKETL